jgi:hypothetical protein
MAYSEISVVVDGALEEEQTFTDYLLEAEYLDRIEEEATDHGYPTEVFRLYHEHNPSDEDCGCIQYVQDHHPYASYNTK